MTLPLQPVRPGFDLRLRNLTDRKIASNVFLQQLLYYRIFFNVAWLIFWMVFIFKNLPWLLMFTILSLVPEQGTILYLLVGTSRRTAYTKAVQIVMLVLQWIELLTGLYTCVTMYKVQKRQFYLFEYILNARRRQRLHAPGMGSPGR
ncbi:hypothetical protein Vretimale_252 [Volvox reticuliferus]|uniref:Uncharacterized protein n=1 Tax=Volvox reticuliferus TaxID=1737510 RepID=A0A8J4FY55_9CHLO|nr:hypothetical protein Vretimale_252 [Volvox reticuliferus]